MLVTPAGHVEVELVEVDVVAAPRDGVAVGVKDDADDGGGRAVGAVLAGNPLGG